MTRPEPDPLTPAERREVEYLRAWLTREPRPSGLGVILGVVDRLVSERRDAAPAMVEPPYTDCNDRKCGACSRCRGAVKGETDAIRKARHEAYAEGYADGRALTGKDVSK